MSEAPELTGADVRELKPLRQALVQLQFHVRPMHADFQVLEAAIRSIDQVAEQVTGRADFLTLDMGRR